MKSWVTGLLLGLAIPWLGCTAPSPSAGSPGVTVGTPSTTAGTDPQDAAALQAVLAYKVCPDQPDTLAIAASTTYRVLSYQEQTTSVTGHASDLVIVSTTYLSGGVQKTTTWNYH